MNSPAPRALYVYVPGIGSDHSERLRELITARADEKARAAGGTAELVVFRHDIKAWTIRDSLHPDSAAERLNSFISIHAGFSSEEPRATEVIVIAHSLGGLIARSAWLKNRGYDFPNQQKTGVIRRTDNGWAAITSRIVLLGVPNGGFTLKKWSSWWWIYQLATPWFDFAVEDASAGAYWVANLRLRWLEAFRDLPDENLPYVAQVLGETDGLVTDADLGDTQWLPATPEKPAKIGGADHGGLIDLRDPEEAKIRWSVLGHAIFGAKDEIPPRKKRSSDPVVFILHGIRATNSDPWVSEMTDHMKSLGAHVVAPNTGFFSAWEFFLPFSRNRKSHEFLRYYGDAALSHNPDNFVLLGHSNGTYMAGRSMERTPAVRFNRILLAGTVLEPTYPWQLLINRQQIGTRVGTNGDVTWQNGVVHNERASRDWPVGVLCNLIMGLRPFNRMVGPGGVIGFVGVDDNIVTKDELVYKGGHASALMTSADGRKEQIATFLTTGVHNDNPPAPSKRGFLFLGRLVSWLAWPLLVALAALLVWALIAVWLSAGWIAALLWVVVPMLVVYALLRWM